MICDHILSHAHHDKRKTKEEKKINNVIANHIVKHMYLMTKKERKKEKEKRKRWLHESYANSLCSKICRMEPSDLSP
jgi:hypothetical protein